MDEPTKLRKYIQFLGNISVTINLINGDINVMIKGFMFAKTPWLTKMKHLSAILKKGGTKVKIKVILIFS